MGDVIPFTRRAVTSALAGGASREGYLSKHQAAAYLGCSTRTIERYASEDHLPFYRVRGRNLYRVSELDRWVERVST